VHSSPLNPSDAGYAAHYVADTVITERVKKKNERIRHSITNFTVSYVAESDSVTLTLASKQTFQSGGQITVLGGRSGGVTGSTGKAKQR
jgi:hypothetical protein